MESLLQSPGHFLLALQRTAARFASLTINDCCLSLRLLCCVCLFGAGMGPGPGHAPSDTSSTTELQGHPCPGTHRYQAFLQNVGAIKSAGILVVFRGRKGHVLPLHEAQEGLQRGESRADPGEGCAGCGSDLGGALAGV